MLRVFGKDYINLHFVARAINLKHNNGNLTLLYIDQDNIVGTDGHRLHLTPNTLELAPGLYHVVKRTKTELHLVLSDMILDEYPNFKRLFPDFHKDCAPFFSFKSVNVFNQYAQVIRAMETNSLDFNYFQESDPGQFEDFRAHDIDPLYMLSANGNKCLIMPFRGDK